MGMMLQVILHEHINQNDPAQWQHIAKTGGGERSALHRLDFDRHNQRTTYNLPYSVPGSV